MSVQDHLPEEDWDAVICGTGLKQSLLAVALSRASLSVVQLDSNTYYGESETAFSLEELDIWVAKTNAGGNPGFSDAAVNVYNPEGLKRSRDYTISLAPHVIYWGSPLLEMLRKADMTGSLSWQAVGTWWIWGRNSIYDPEDEAAAAGGLVKGMEGLMMDAGTKVAKTVRGRKGWNKGRAKVPPAATVTNETELELGSQKLAQKTAETSTLRTIGTDIKEVPCTFEDIAWSPDLTDKDRGYLGAFLRFVVYHDSETPDAATYRKLFMENLSTPLTKFLSTHFPLPSATVAAIHSLTLLATTPASTPLSKVIPRLAIHARSLGKIPDVKSAAALTIADGGSAELPQVFSRGSAVAGGLNVLGRGVDSVVPSELKKDKLEIGLSNSETIYAKWYISSTSSVKPLPPPAEAVEEKLSKGAWVINDPFETFFAKKYDDDRIMPSVGILTFPKGSIKPETSEGAVEGEGGGEGGRNQYPVYIIAREASTCECPRGQTLLYTFTAEVGESGYEVMKRAVKVFLESYASGTSPPLAKAPEILYSMFYTHSIPSSLTSAENHEDPRIIRMSPVSLDLAFDPKVVEDVMNVYAKIVGTRDGFMDLPEAIRKMKEEMEEED